MALRNFFIRRISFARHLQNSNSALTTSRYFRLMSMSLIQIFWTITIISLSMAFRFRNGVRPWTGWADVHYNFSRVAQFPEAIIPKNDWAWTYALWWTIPVSSVVFFGFFSFGEDVMKEYGQCIAWVKTKIFRQKDAEESAKTK
jgi:pheromone a factor receptor